MAIDPLRHPDLARIGRRMRDQLDDVLMAEQEAARAARNRSRTLRDRLLEAEDCAETVTLSGDDGQVYRGTVGAVGVDHVVVGTDGRELFVALDHVVSAEFR